MPLRRCSGAESIVGCLLLWVACAGGPAPAQTPTDLNQPPPEFSSLFNGTDLSGWWGLGTVDPRQWQDLVLEQQEHRRRASLDDVRRHWRVENGELVNDGHGLFLTTERRFGDFELLVDSRLEEGADSGIYLRGIPQVQIWDHREEAGFWRFGADKGSGGLWNNPVGSPGREPRVLADRPPGQWNRFRIVMVGERVTVHLNDRLVVEHARMSNFFDPDRPLPRRGPIQLQTHGGAMRWRNIFVREIPPEEANAILAQHEPAGFESVFNGRDLHGWAGAMDGYEVLDGALACRAGHGGTLHTVQSYDDFAVRLELLLPPGANNGLAIRYPGSGDTAYVGMCELQVLDDAHRRFADLDPRQYHGSVYGQVAAHRGYLRPAGAWNFQEVVVRGSRITVELNGTRIVDADLAEVTDFMYEAERFAGRTRTQGHFGFAGHGDPVRFRDIRIKRLGGGSDQASERPSD